jgi:5-methylcytosine-specific restriction endonuclease McrA
MGILLLVFLAIIIFIFNRWMFDIQRKQRKDYYRKYLQSDDWKRKRYIVLKRDNWSCVYCGARATQVHHKRYAKKNIGKEPIEWLVSVCNNCHYDIHH